MPQAHRYRKTIKVLWWTIICNNHEKVSGSVETVSEEKRPNELDWLSVSTRNEEWIKHHQHQHLPAGDRCRLTSADFSELSFFYEWSKGAKVKIMLCYVFLDFSLHGNLVTVFSEGVEMSCFNTRRQISVYMKPNYSRNCRPLSFHLTCKLTKHQHFLPRCSDKTDINSLHRHAVCLYRRRFTTLSVWSTEERSGGSLRSSSWEQESPHERWDPDHVVT